MRIALLGLLAGRLRAARSGRPEIDLRALTNGLLSGDVAAPTADVDRLITTGVDAGVFYEKELSKSWELLSETSARLASSSSQAYPDAREADADARPPNYDQMLASVRTKTLLLAFAFARPMATSAGSVATNKFHSSCV